jgi:Spy/CpxP family protein refolding chaperone
MMKLNKLMSVFASLVAVSVVAVPFTVKADAIHNGQPLLAQAQQNSHKKEGGRWAKLNLTDAQKQQLRQIEKDSRQQIEGVYTPQQLAQLKAARTQHQQGQHTNRRDVMKSLNLTDSQKAQIKQIITAQKAKMDSVFTPEQRQQLEQQRAQWQQQHK